jgi:hypothetical protein
LFSEVGAGDWVEGDWVVVDGVGVGDVVGYVVVVGCVGWMVVWLVMVTVITET